MTGRRRYVTPDEVFERFVIMYEPKDSEPPILTPPIRQAMRQWMSEIRSEERLAAVNLEPRRSALLAGPPGCGKTTLAHHLSARLGMPMALVNLQTVVSVYIGESGQNINLLFEAARERLPNLIMFLDEFDAVASQRMDAGTGAGHEKNAVVIAFLQQLDRYDGVIMAATNRGDAIDPAIWRRFGMQLEISEPDDEARFAILTRYLAPMSLPQDEMDYLCEVTAGATPALLQQLMEGVKRDIVLSEHLKQDDDAWSVFARIISTINVHADIRTPRLWASPTSCLDKIKSFNWPPEWPDREDAA